MTGLFAALTPAELAALRDELRREYATAIPARCEPFMVDLSYLLHEVSRAGQGLRPSRAVERYWTRGDR